MHSNLNIISTKSGYLFLLCLNVWSAAGVGGGVGGGVSVHIRHMEGIRLSICGSCFYFFLRIVCVDTTKDVTSLVTLFMPHLNTVQRLLAATPGMRPGPLIVLKNKLTVNVVLFLQWFLCCRFTNSSGIKKTPSATAMATGHSPKRFLRLFVGDWQVDTNCPIRVCVAQDEHHYYLMNWGKIFLGMYEHGRPITHIWLRRLVDFNYQRGFQLCEDFGAHYQRNYFLTYSAKISYGMYVRLWDKINVANLG